MNKKGQLLSLGRRSQALGLEYLATAGGFGAILLWSTTVALTRALSEQLGPIIAGATVYSVSSVVALVHVLLRRQEHQLATLSRRYLYRCGSLFVIYTLAFYIAIGLAANRNQVLEVGLLNYLWPTLTLLLSAVFLGHRLKWHLIPGTVLALAGVFLVLTQGNGVTRHIFAGSTSHSIIPYFLGIAAAVSWALYSNLARKWGGEQQGGAMPLFMAAAAVTLVIMSFLFPRPHAWTANVLGEAVFLGIASYAAYFLWDLAMRQGNMVLVAAGSYLTPFFSTLVSVLYLAVSPKPVLWLSCLLLVTGSIISWRAIKDVDTGD